MVKGLRSSGVLPTPKTGTAGGTTCANPMQANTNFCTVIL